MSKIGTFKPFLQVFWPITFAKCLLIATTRSASIRAFQRCINLPIYLKNIRYRVSQKGRTPLTNLTFRVLKFRFRVLKFRFRVLKYRFYPQKKMFFLTRHSAGSSGKKTFSFGGLKMWSVAEHFQPAIENVNLSPIPKGGVVGRFWTFFGGLCLYHSFLMVPTLFVHFEMLFQKIGVSYLGKAPFGHSGAWKVATSGIWSEKWEIWVVFEVFEGFWGVLGENYVFSFL